MSGNSFESLQSGLNNAIAKEKTLNIKKADGQQAKQSIDASIREVHNMESDLFSQQSALVKDLTDAKDNLYSLMDYYKSCPPDEKETIQAAIVSAKNQISILEAKNNELEKYQNQLIAKDNQLTEKQISIYEDNKLTNEELVSTSKLINDLAKQIEQRKAEIKEAREYADNASGACQKGIDVIFGTDGSKGRRQVKTANTSQNNNQLPTYKESPSKSESSSRKTGGSWLSASRDWNQNLYN